MNPWKTNIVEVEVLKKNAMSQTRHLTSLQLVFIQSEIVLYAKKGSNPYACNIKRYNSFYDLIYQQRERRRNQERET